MQSYLQDLAEQLSDEGNFLGGPARYFDYIGRIQFIVLLKHGILPSHKVLDVGCGCLRAGFWLIYFLEPHCYFGIEPNKQMLEIGKDRILGNSILNVKKPIFSNNDQFDFSVFKEKFDFVLARSIWSHASPDQIKQMLNQFALHGSNKGIFLTSYIPATDNRPQYEGNEWVGRSHKSDMPGTVTYELDWIRSECEKRDLIVSKIRRNNIFRQIWLRIQRKDTEFSTLPNLDFTARKSEGLDPSQVAFHLELGRLLFKKGDIKEAENAFRKAVELDPEHAGANHTLSRILERQDKLDEAIRFAKKSVNIKGKKNYSKHLNMLIERKNKRSNKQLQNIKVFARRLTEFLSGRSSD